MFLVVAAAAALAVRVIDVDVRHLQWGTNVATLTIANDDLQPHVITIDVQTRVGESGGVGWQSEHTIPASTTLRVRREFFIRPLPGRATVHLSVREAQSEFEARDYRDDFPIGGAPMDAVHISWEAIWRRGDDAVPSTIAAYPPLEKREKGPFVFFFTPGDTFAQSHIDALATERGEVLRRLTTLLAPAFCGQIAFYLFPDRVTKFAYTLHHGAGWATGRAIVEIFNEHEQLDASHELVHIVAGSVGTPPAFLREGLAVALQRDMKWEGETIDAWSHAFHSAGMLVPAQQLFALIDIGPAETLPAITYPEAGSFVNYLIARFGMRAVMTAYAQLKSSDDPHWIAQNAVEFESIFGVPLDRAYADWLSSVDAKGATVPAARIEAIRAKISAH